MVNKSLVVALLWILFTIVHAYRDGAREESCYNHSIEHEGAFIRPCADGCRYFLRVKEVVNEATLELGNETTSYECGKVYGIEVANDLNAPEGYLVQARDGTEDSSEIIGTFLDPTVVEERVSDPDFRVNFKILQCGRSMNSTEELLDNSATHPDTVNMAGTLQLYWQAPNCTDEDLPNVTLWFTIVQQLTVVYNPSKSTVLTYIPPDVVVSTSTVAAVLPTSTEAFPMPTMTPSSEEGTGASTTTREMVEDATSFPVVILAASVSAGGVALIILIIIFVVSVIIYAKSSATGDHDRNHTKKSKHSRVSALWVASTTEPEPANSNGKQVDFVEDRTDHEPLTVKNGKDDK